MGLPIPPSVFCHRTKAASFSETRTGALYPLRRPRHGNKAGRWRIRCRQCSWLSGSVQTVSSTRLLGGGRQRAVFPGGRTQWSGTQAHAGLLGFSPLHCQGLPVRYQTKIVYSSRPQFAHLENGIITAPPARACLGSEFTCARPFKQW